MEWLFPVALIVSSVLTSWALYRLSREVDLLDDDW